MVLSQLGWVVGAQGREVGGMVALGTVDWVLPESPPMGVRRQYVAGFRYHIAGLQATRRPSVRVDAGSRRERLHGK